MQELWMQLQEQVGAFVPSLIGAIAILVVGWLFSLAVGAVVRGVIDRATRGRKIVEVEGKSLPLGKWVGRAVFYILMVFVLAAAFQTLSLEAISGPLDAMLERFTAFIPKLIGAGVILLVAWTIGYVLRLIVSRALAQTNLDERIAAGAGLETQKPLSKTLGDVVFWLPMLLFLPAVLSTLQLEGLVGPIQAMFDDLLAVLPDVLGAALILLLGWFIARIVRQILSGLLAAAGADRLGENVGMGPGAGERRLSNVIGLLAYALILIPTAIAALDALRLEGISGPATLMLNQVLAAVPMLFGAALILAVAFVVGRVVSRLVASVLAGVGFDSLFTKMGLQVKGDRAHRTPSEIAGYLTLVAIMLVAAIEAADMLGFVGVAELTTQFFTFGTRLLLGLVIFGVGLYLGNLAYRAIPTGDGRWGGLLPNAARVAIIVLATAMALQQTGVAQEIVQLAFGMVLGAAALAGAIAFGLGARDAAARTVNDWLDQG